MFLRSFATAASVSLPSETTLIPNVALILPKHVFGHCQRSVPDGVSLSDLSIEGRKGYIPNAFWGAGLVLGALRYYFQISLRYFTRIHKM